MTQKYELEISISVDPSGNEGFRIFGGRLFGSIFFEDADNLSANKFVLEKGRDIERDVSKNYKLMLYRIGENGLRE